MYSKNLLTALVLFCWPALLFGQNRQPRESVVSRFLRYVKIDTRSAEDQATVPSTKVQLDLARVLAAELKKMGLQNVRISQYGFVYAMLPGNLRDNNSVPTLGLIAHMDTYTGVSGTNVSPIIHKNYQGGDIVLPKDTTQVISVEKNPILKDMIGDDIITADGTTLLGSDDKAGIAEIMTLLDILLHDPSIKHGNLAIAFTPDEETSTGIEKFDVKGFGAKFAYTVDGEELGEISTETWSARSATVSFEGVSTHAGTAKGKMINAGFALGYFLTLFPRDMLPETTEGRTGFVHPYSGKVDVEQSTLKILLRSYTIPGLDSQEAVLRSMIATTQEKFPRVKINMTVKKDYLNMQEVLKNYPELTENAMEASRRAGIKPFLKAVRGGTDGSSLTFRGLPTPNLFTGGQNFHGKTEFNSRKGLEKTTEMLVQLVQLFAGKK
jgi:tripeptide aminopeptidase